MLVLANMRQRKNSPSHQWNVNITVTLNHRSNKIERDITESLIPCLVLTWFRRERDSVVSVNDAVGAVGVQGWEGRVQGAGDERVATNGARCLPWIRYAVEGGRGARPRLGVGAAQVPNFYMPGKMNATTWRQCRSGHNLTVRRSIGLYGAVNRDCWLRKKKN